MTHSLLWKYFKPKVPSHLFPTLAGSRNKLCIPSECSVGERLGELFQMEVKIFSMHFERVNEATDILFQMWCLEQLLPDVESRNGFSGCGTRDNSPRMWHLKMDPCNVPFVNKSFKDVASSVASLEVRFQQLF